MRQAMARKTNRDIDAEIMAVALQLDGLLDELGDNVDALTTLLTAPQEPPPPEEEERLAVP
jgi:hypothetical protein